MVQSVLLQLFKVFTKVFSANSFGCLNWKTQHRVFYKFLLVLFIEDKEDKGNILDVQSQIFNFISFFPQELNIYISLFTAKKFRYFTFKG